MRVETDAHGVHVVVGVAEHAGAAAVAGEQQRTRGRRGAAHRGEQLVQVLGGAGGVADLEAHGGADLDEVTRDDGAVADVDGQHRADQEVAAVVGLGVLVDGDAQVQPGQRLLLLLGQQGGDDLAQPLGGGPPGELGDPVVPGAGDDHRRPDGAASLADDDPRVGRTAEQHPDRPAVVHGAPGEQPVGPGSAGSAGQAPDHREPRMGRREPVQDPADREHGRVGQQDGHMVVLGGWDQPAHRDRVASVRSRAGAALRDREERPDPGAGQRRRPDGDGGLALDTAAVGHHAVRGGPDRRAGSGELHHPQSGGLGLLDRGGGPGTGADEERHEVGDRTERRQRLPRRDLRGPDEIRPHGQPVPHPRALAPTHAPDATSAHRSHTGSGVPHGSRSRVGDAIPCGTQRRGAGMRPGRGQRR